MTYVVFISNIQPLSYKNKNKNKNITYYLYKNIKNPIN